MSFTACPSFYYPLVAFPFQQIAQIHSRSGRGTAFRLQVNGGGCFVLAVYHIGDADIHGEKVRALGQVRQHALAHGIRTLDVALAASRQERDQERGCENGGAVHNLDYSPGRRAACQSGQTLLNFPKFLMGESKPQSGDLLQGTLDMLILKTLVRGPLHGYSIAEFIHQTSENALRVEEGALYPALHRLELRGLLASEWGVSENNRRAKFYRLTAAGKKQLAQETSHWGKMAAAIARILEAT